MMADVAASPYLSPRLVNCSSVGVSLLLLLLPASHFAPPGLKQVSFGWAIIQTKERHLRSNIICDSKHMIVELSDGSLYNISWKGEFCGVVNLDISLSDGSGAGKLSHSLDNGLPSNGAQGVSLPMNYMRKKSAIVHMEFSFSLRLLFLLFCDGQLVSCSASKKGLKQANLIKVEKKLASGYAVCASVASEQQILAVGTKRGDAELYDLTDSASLVRAVSLYDWG